jgi:hypothetical protein
VAYAAQLTHVIGTQSTRLDTLNADSPIDFFLPARDFGKLVFDLNHRFLMSESVATSGST